MLNKQHLSDECAFCVTPTFLVPLSNFVFVLFSFSVLYFTLLHIISAVKRII